MRFFAYGSLALALCAACGEVKGDGGLADAPTGTDDAMTDAPTTGTVKVTVLDSGGSGSPAVGAKVTFINPDGTVVKDVATDGNGKAEADVMIGASVTSAQLTGDTYVMQTTLAVKPGDDLILGSKNSDTSSAITMTVSWTAYGGTFASYVIIGPCGTTSAAPSSLSASLTLYPYCTRTSNEFLVLAISQAGEVVVSARKTGVTAAGGTTVAMPATWESARSFTASYTNINATVASLQLLRAVPDSFGFSTSASVSTPATTASLATAGGTASVARVQTTARNTNGSRQLIIQSLSGAATTYGVDVSATLLPWLSPPTFDGAHTILVPTDTTGTSTAKPDFFRLLVNYRRTDGTTGAITFYNWVIYGPEIADVSLPPLPGGLTPISSDVINLSDLALEVQEANGWDAMRPDPAGLFSKYISGFYAGSQVRETLSPQLRGFQ